MATDDRLVRERPKSTILADIKAAAERGAAREAEPELAEGDQLIALPQPGDPYETAHARSSNKPVPTLHFIMGDTVRGLPYANLDSIDLVAADKPGGGPVIVIRFTGIVPREARITGRHLAGLYHLLGSYRVAWVAELPKGRDFKGDSATVVTGIAINRITEAPS